MVKSAPPSFFSGFLDGASWPGPPEVVVPSPPLRIVKVAVPNPEGENQTALRPGDAFVVKLGDDSNVSVRVPANAAPGQLMQVLVPDYSRMLASTLSTPPPGCRILSQRPIVFANVSQEILAPTKSQSPSQQMASIMQGAQKQLLREAHSAGCNAVLGMSFSVTTTGQGATALAMVSVSGTPCAIIREGSRPSDVAGNGHAQVNPAVGEAIIAADASVPAVADATSVEEDPAAGSKAVGVPDTAGKVEEPVSGVEPDAVDESAEASVPAVADATSVEEDPAAGPKAVGVPDTAGKVEEPVSGVEPDAVDEAAEASVPAVVDATSVEEDPAAGLKAVGVPDTAGKDGETVSGVDLDALEEAAEATEVMSGERVEGDASS